MADRKLSTIYTDGDVLETIPNSAKMYLSYADASWAADFDVVSKNAITAGLGEVDSTITPAGTLADVFVYDTSLDTDGGTWRHRCQHTSWYNETLNTATRGGRREFPAVAVIVAESDKVTIYDGDDPALPMWMVFPAGANGIQGINTNSSIKSVYALNGKLITATNGASVEYQSGLPIADFAKDMFSIIRGAAIGEVFIGTGLIANRGSGVLGSMVNDHRLVSGYCNDVAMTVLPDAPIDPATGLPVPTIAVATDGGVSVINDDGAVADSSETAGMAHVRFSNEGRLFYNDDASDQVYYADTYASDGFGDGHYDTDAAPYTLPGNVIGLTESAVGHADGLTLLKEDQATKTNGMVAFITSDYNTGWMNGDIKGAFLADTDDTDLADSGELVTNGTFDTDTSGWSDVSSGTGSISWNSSGYLQLNSGSISDRGQARYSVPTVIGSTYYLTIECVSSTSPSCAVFVGSTGGGSQYKSIVSVTTGTYEVTFTATTTTASVQLVGVYGSGTANFDNISVKLADADRSVNNNGLIVNGTITRTAVATGADLKAYSGFSTSNYLEQPYNADLDFGTGAFTVVGWIKQAANSAVETILERDSATTAQRFTLDIDASGDLRFTVDDDTTTRVATSSRTIDTDTWTHVVALYDGAGGVYLYLDGEEDASETGAALLTLNNANAVLNVGLAVDGADPLTNGALALWRISATAPTAEQIKKIYEDEKVLFQENAQATLYGTSDAVTALAHDPVTDLLHVGTSDGRSAFQGLRRVDNTTDAVSTAISAANNMIVED